ncbi:unnamed protein product [Blepharisma stoltei]|uniref:Uncharacterized protein n=1 Tax=Blepharisma stoltei TaxID=1481888 RepID=A0AAU9K8Y0_9CILI|nr:unnamed protein product [Blepharisma stoltei]
MQESFNLLNLSPDDLTLSLQDLQPIFSKMLIEGPGILHEFVTKLNNQHYALMSQFMTVFYETMRNSKQFQQQLFIEIESFCLFSQILLNKLIEIFPNLYIEFEKRLFEFLNGPSTIISNFALTILMQALAILEEERVSAIILSIWNEVKEMQSYDHIGVTRYLRLIAFSQVELKEKILGEIRLQNWKLAILLACNIGENGELSYQVRDLINEESPSELHIIYCTLLGNSYDELAVELFKVFVSKIWVTSSHKELTEMDCCAIIKYCQLSALQSSLSDFEVLKAVFATLNLCITNLAKFKSKEFLNSIILALENLSSASILEKYQPKFKGEFGKLIQALIKETCPILSSHLIISLEKMQNWGFSREYQRNPIILQRNELLQISENLVEMHKKSENQYFSPIIELQKLLGLPLLSELERNNSFFLAEAVEKIAQKIRENSESINSF